ncbi:GNAT family N-acetyltransferase [Mycolicibacterium thermoresistibile]|uniref:Acetyltransferase n=2 Tax=Mycolicibacterium thermoresistibile TaxID=1797 RepID=G7CCJ6_MYCT3|nr:GNAT family N-acetyltransferase [Mycolicibacterium thermoresistibile]EHI14299.1 acetyltransferase [Mycolicibacterium thermoresistibile ATCC 19527]MCV7190599.1 GNAT family N-acetyltransferase [Mycolicibacterium thermoresistibile]GAT14398.1 acetyltransferase [Mycolicibacterium thermoresistibile]SNW19435.1 acetyltransferase [Mycolicibacterium thermoresistibile]
MTTVETLAGPRVRLRPPRTDDADTLFSRVCSDPQVARFVSWRPHVDVRETRRVIDTIFNANARAGSKADSGADTDRTWVMDLTGVGVVGLCGWRRPEPHAVEFGYCLGRRWWGRGLASEALSLLIDAVSRDERVYRLWAVCHVDNAASAAVLRRCGLTLEGRLARYAVLPNLGSEPQDVLLFAKAVR